MMEQGDVRVVYWPPQGELAERTLAAAAQPFPLPGIPGGTRLVEGTIILAPTPALWDSVTGGRAPEWSAGVANPRTRTIVLPSYEGGLFDPIITLRHELAHLALNQHLPRPIPRWFDEGYATWASGGWDQGSAWQLRLAFLLGRAPRLDSLTLDWPRGAERARFAYLLSASAVRHLAERGGERGLAEIFRVWRREGDLDRSVRRVYGITLGQFEAEWQRSVRRRYGWLLAFSQVSVFWLFLSLLLFVLWAVRRRRIRARFRELEAEDRMLPPPRETDLDADPHQI